MREPTQIQQPLAMRIYCLLFGLLVVGTMVPSAIRSGPDGILILLFVAVGGYLHCPSRVT
jgi:branched-subunit amino acid transport protein AzlD